MRAVVQRRYGPPADVLEVGDVDQPRVDPGEVLVEVHAASVHPDVWHVVTGRPLFLRLMGAGLMRPKVVVPGTDLAGRVVEVGEGVTRFRRDDEVFGETVRGHQWLNGGAFAEYAAVPAAKLEPMPAGLSFVEAAAVPTSGLIAIQNARGVAEGDEVLVNGAGGAVGSFAVQIVKAQGATVTAVDVASKLDMLRTIGADHVVDFEREDFTLGGRHYDVIVDIPGNRSFADLKRVLAEDGRYVFIGHDRYGAAGHRVLGAGLPRFLKMALLRPFGRRQKAPPPVEKPLAALRQLIEEGSVRPVIDRTFALGEAVDALRYLAEGRATGRVVLTVRS